MVKDREERMEIIKKKLKRTERICIEILMRVDIGVAGETESHKNN